MEKRVVLFVDDEPKILNAIARELHNEPYDLEFASSGPEAMSVLCRKSIQVIVTDMGMPGMSGLELLQRAKEEYPHLVRIVLSGSAQSQDLLDAVNEGDIYRYIVKPWSGANELKLLIRKAIDHHDLYYERCKLMDFFEQWIEGVQPDPQNIQFLKELLKTQKQHLAQWKRTCETIPVNSSNY